MQKNSKKNIRYSSKKNIETEIEKLKEKNKNRISDENLLKIIKEFKATENFDNEIIKMLIEKIEVYKDKTVNIIFKI